MEQMVLVPVRAASCWAGWVRLTRFEQQQRRTE
jgi:hypothetical protein